MKTPVPLLITATLDSGKTPYVALSSTSARIEAHMEGLLAWCREPWVGSIVLAKNCSTKIRSEVLIQAAASHGKNLEFVQTASSPRTIRQGKGYGEGDMIRQALEQSALLREADDFIKVTGKLFCRDTRQLLQGEGSGEFFLALHQYQETALPIRRWLSPLYRSEKGSAVMAFLKNPMRVPWGLLGAVPSALVDTRLYRVNRNFYLEVLSGAYRRVQDAMGYTLEHAFYDNLAGRKGSVTLLNISPGIIGVSGSVGTRAGEFPEEIRAEARNLAALLVA
jgi:hypothetical protein